MVQNLSNLVKNPFTAIAPTSQSAGNSVSSNELAQSAPGTPPVDPAIAAEHQSDPAITPVDYTDSPVEVGTGGASVTPGHVNRSSIFNRADGSPWQSASDTAVEVSSRSMLKRGRWNNI